MTKETGPGAGAGPCTAPGTMVTARTCTTVPPPSLGTPHDTVHVPEHCRSLDMDLREPVPIDKCTNDITGFPFTIYQHG